MIRDYVEHNINNVIFPGALEFVWIIMKNAKFLILCQKNNDFSKQLDDHHEIQPRSPRNPGMLWAPIASVRASVPFPGNHTHHTLILTITHTDTHTPHWFGSWGRWSRWRTRNGHRSSSCPRWLRCCKRYWCHCNTPDPMWWCRRCLGGQQRRGQGKGHGYVKQRIGVTFMKGETVGTGSVEGGQVVRPTSES